MNASSYKTVKSGAVSILYFNARSLLPKIDELRALSLAHKPHLICVVETWLDNNIKDCEIHIENYDSIRLDRNRHGGGVMFFVIKSLSYNVILSGPSDLEFIVLQIKSFYCAFTVGLFYRPPNAPVCIFDNLLNSLCSQVGVSLLSNFILLGDFNINMTNPHSHLYSKIQSFALSLCLSQIV